MFVTRSGVVSSLLTVDATTVVVVLFVLNSFQFTGGYAVTRLTNGWAFTAYLLLLFSPVRKHHGTRHISNDKHSEGNNAGVDPRNTFFSFISTTVRERVGVLKREISRCGSRREGGLLGTYHLSTHLSQLSTNFGELADYHGIFHSPEDHMFSQ